MDRVLSNLVIATFAGLVLWLPACTSGPAETAESDMEPIYYPAPPDPPRLQFLTSFSVREPWNQGQTRRKSSFEDFIVGHDRQAQGKGQIDSPYGLAAADGKLYICDVGFGMVHVLDFQAKRYHALGTAQHVKNPTNLAITPDGWKYVCDTGKQQIVVFDEEDRFVRYLGDPKQTVPCDVAVGEEELYVVDVRGGEVEVWSMDGEPLRTISNRGRGPSELFMPTNIAVDTDGHLYVSDTAEGIVKVFDRDGQLLRFIGEPGDRPGDFARPKGLVIDSEQNIFVADAQWEVIQGFTREGYLLIFFGSPSIGPEGTGMPAGLTLDRSCLPAFAKHVHPDFAPEYLLFVANQFGRNKIGVYAYGRSKNLSAKAYEVEVESKPESTTVDAEEAADAGE